MSNVQGTRTLRASFGVGTLVVGILVVATCAAAQTTAPVVYQGLRHIPIGNAHLSLDTSRNTLDVTTMDPNGRDGVAVDLGGQATSWAAHLGPQVDRTLRLIMSLNAIADGERISTAVLRQTGAGIALSARFTGATKPTYAVHVYNSGRLVGALGGLPPTAQTHIPRLPCEFFENGCGFTQRFHNNVNGACEWHSALPGPAPIVLPDGKRVVGNEVRFIEEVNPAGHYPYLTFDGVTMQTNARVLTLLSETAR